MSLTVKALDRNGATAMVAVTRFADHCPRCHKGIDPKFVSASLTTARLQVVFRCPLLNCDETFISTYTRNQHSTAPLYSFERSDPMNVQIENFAQTVTDVSPMFAGIHRQAMAAESQGLDQLVGIGLRKALEFLVKDFAMKQNPEQSESIKRMPLAQCIDQFISDANIKACAKRAAWLGNDETHYIRKWEGRDIDDLKLLVRLTSNWVDNVLLTEQYVAQMQAPER